MHDSVCSHTVHWKQITFKVDSFFPDDNFDLLATCQCISFQKCPWATKTVKLIAEGVPLEQLFQVNICDKVKKRVWCCKNSRGQSTYPSTFEQLKILVSIKRKSLVSFTKLFRHIALIIDIMIAKFSYPLVFEWIYLHRNQEDSSKWIRMNGSNQMEPHPKVIACKFTAIEHCCSIHL